ncbi:hypothetical protein COI87_17720 [Bacillus thuringiensis]|uniref:Uncharacterized protein n=1 Tax=Bacillus cereus TaxID=1396 RepID=A0A9X6YRX0_BACCE|nr:hypothetical protein COM79_01670 [Bacillus cereus]PEB85173.1 hypothetical protein COM94_20755 [Bacillus thuringiensis]PEQ86659.1 hypothetical protein CN475_15580 [Bacillus cereus]PFJ10430.1 hypothetical protein COI87_17720 [Bacillus thuringiensis]PFN32824.1 hypothetical protein COJ56_27665 [Bacillus thuringiensis]
MVMVKLFLHFQDKFDDEDEISLKIETITLRNLIHIWINDHTKQSELTPAEKAKEIREHWKKRGSEYVLPGEGI